METASTDIKTPLNIFKKKHVFDNKTPLKIPGSPLMKKLGYGTGIAVYLLSGRKAKTSSGSPWAIKKCLKEKTDKTYAIRLEAEAEVLRSLTHPHIVGFRSFTKAEDGRYNLAMEACTASLGDILEKRFSSASGPLEPGKISIMGCDISKALSYLHNEALLLHGDMKSFNILVKGDFAICKLCDFGVSLPLTKDGLLDFEKRPAAQYVGTELWNAPETFEEDETLISTKTEIFSFGLVVYECIALCPPHTLSPFPVDSKKALDFDDTIEDDEEDELDYMVGTRPDFAEDMKLPEQFNDILEIFHMCTNDEPEERPSAKELEIIFSELKKYFTAV